MTSPIRMPPSTTYTPEQALHVALGDELQDVLIAGYSAEGELVVRSSRLTRAEGLFLAMKLVSWSLNGEIV